MCLLKESSYLHDTSIFLQFIPMPVLYGVFLYMGASSLRGIQVKLFEFHCTSLNASFVLLTHHSTRKHKDTALSSYDI